MRHQPNRDYQSNDLIMTPPPLARAIVAQLELEDPILEPCMGEGAFIDAITEQLGEDAEIYACELEFGRDFFAWHQPVEWIVTNPPWSQFNPFLKHSLELANRIVMLASVNHWWTKRRVEMVREAGFGYHTLFLLDWPKAWPQTGFQLGAMLIERGWEGPLEIRRVAWDDAKGAAQQSAPADGTAELAGLAAPSTTTTCMVNESAVPATGSSLERLRAGFDPTTPEAGE